MANYVTSTVETVLALHREERSGDILAFLTGQEEVDTAVSQLRWVWPGCGQFGMVSSVLIFVKSLLILLDKMSLYAALCEVSTVLLYREHASRSSKGMQLMAAPLYGGLPYGDQVIYRNRYFLVGPLVYTACCSTVEGVPESSTKHQKGSSFPHEGIFSLSILFSSSSFFNEFLQVVVATNIAETSVTIPGIVFGKSC